MACSRDAVRRFQVGNRRFSRPDTVEEIVGMPLELIVLIAGAVLDSRSPGLFRIARDLSAKALRPDVLPRNGESSRRVGS